MGKYKAKDLLNLTFKIPPDKDRSIRANYYPLSPKQYLDFIECGMNLTPNLKIYIEQQLKKDKLKVKFKL